MNKLLKTIPIAIIALLTTISHASILKNVKLDLFTIEKEGKLSYIVGTIHNIPLNKIQEEIKTVLTSQDYLVIEHPGNDESGHAPLLLDENDTIWWNELSSDEQETLLKFSGENVKNYKIDFVCFQLFNSLSSKVQEKTQNQEENQKYKGVDYDLINLYAKENIYALETVAEASKSLIESKGSANIETLKSFLFAIQIIEGPDSAIKDYIINSLLKSMVSTMTKMTKPENHNTEKPYEILVDDRNLLWIDRIESYHKNLNGKVLFAFGRAHLYSNQGILKLLKDRDFNITKITFNSNEDNWYRVFMDLYLHYE